MAVINGQEIYFGIIGETSDGKNAPAVEATLFVNTVITGTVHTAAEVEETEGE